MPSIAALAPDFPGSRRRMRRAIGWVLMLISAARLRRPSSIIHGRSISCRSTPRSASTSWRAAKSTCWLAIRRGPCLDRILPAFCWSVLLRRPGIHGNREYGRRRRRSSSTVVGCAYRKRPRASSISPISSKRTT